jgi:hypothetical protein
LLGQALAVLEKFIAGEREKHSADCGRRSMFGWEGRRAGGDAGRARLMFA